MAGHPRANPDVSSFKAGVMSRLGDTAGQVVLGGEYVQASSSCLDSVRIGEIFDNNFLETNEKVYLQLAPQKLQTRPRIYRDRCSVVSVLLSHFSPSIIHGIEQACDWQWLLCASSQPGPCVRPHQLHIHTKKSVMDELNLG